MATYKNSNISNTGARKVSKATSGATGSATNSVNISTSTGATGAPGRVVIDRTPDIAPMVNGHVAAAREHAREMTGEAFTRASGHLAQARQTALGSVPAEYRDIVNAHFDKAEASLEAHRKRRLGD